ncbi:MAG: FAD:protein FMN transferase [bacterium]
MYTIVEFNGIGTTWFVEFFENVDEAIIENVKLMVQDFENKYSRFISTSEVSILNDQKFLNNPSEDFIKMIAIGEKARALTSGVFDLSIGGILEDMGYDSEKTFIPKKTKRYKTGSIHYDESKITIDSNVKIDLGGVGKGFLVDKVKDYLLNKNINYFQVNAGGDIYATSDNCLDIEFGLENPFNLDESIGTIKIKNKSIASSSNSKRRWKYDNQDFHHLVNINNTSNNVKAVYTFGDRCIDTDIVSTSLYLSPKELHQKISSYYNVEYLIVFEDSTFIKSNNYPADLFKAS